MIPAFLILNLHNVASAVVASITLTSDSEKIPADGFSSTGITATLTDTAGNPAEDGTEVTFITSMGTLSANTAIVENGNGSVIVSLIAGTNSGIATVVCFSEDVSQAINIQIGDEPLKPVAVIGLAVDPNKIPADGFSSAVITATLKDSNGLLVGDGIDVMLSTSLGRFNNNQNSIIVTTDNGEGTVLVSLIAGTTAGIANIVCSSNGVTQKTAIQIGHLPVAAIDLSVTPNKIPADGQASALVKAILTDSGGNPVGDGAIVTITTSLGSFTNNQTSITLTTDSSGTVSVSLIGGTTPGVATIACSSNLIIQIAQLQIGDLPTAYIELTADPGMLLADGYSISIITATLTDISGQPVVKGTAVTFFATPGLTKFSNGETTLTTVTPDDTGVVSVVIIAGNQSGLETITATSSGVSKSITIKIVKLQYETEPNNEMAEADWITFGDAYLAQLSSPYDQDWYVYKTTESGKISINFITTAIPEGSGCNGTTTVGTYRIDIRDTENNVLMSYQNIDCIFDNGIWETGIQNPGTYYIVVYCPRLPNNGHYLSTPYYISAFKPTNIECAPRIQANGQNRFLSVNSATPVAITASMMAGDQNGYFADWWLVYSTPWGNYSLTSYGWTEGIFSLAQFPLFSFPATGIFYQYLYPGKYVFYFGVDISPNWVLYSPLYYDWVIVQVSP